MEINKQNYLEVKQSRFLAVCSFCYNDIISSNDLKRCRTEGCLFRSCPPPECHHVFEKKDYCNNSFTVNQSIHNDTSDCIFSGSNNDDCVTVFGNNVGDDDIQSVANTLRSMSDISLFDRLTDCVVNEPYWVVPEPEQLDSVMRPVILEDCVMRPVECLLLPTEIDISNDNNESVTS